jgi:uncharacterized repeat protein (TIGR01451 family)
MMSALLVIVALSLPATASGAVVPGSVVDVTINISGPTAANAGDAFTYTVRISNNQLPDADGAPFTIALPSGATGVGASCVAAAGATCPVALSVSNATVAGSPATLPHLGTLTLTITGRFGVPSPSSVSVVGHIDPPAGTTDSDTTSNDSSVSTAMNNTADVSVTKTQSADTIAAGDPVTYTMTVANTGPAAADQTSVRDTVSWDTSRYSSADVHVVSCTTTGGVACPSIPADQTLASSDNVLQANTGEFPPGSSFTLTYTLDPTEAADPGCGADSTNFQNAAVVSQPSGITDPDGGNNQVLVSATGPGPGPCPTADVGVTKSQSAATIAPGAPITYTVQ